MSIIAKCGECQKAYKLGDGLAGKRVRCKACGGVVAVPRIAAQAVATSRTSSATRAASTVAARPSARPTSASRSASPTRPAPEPVEVDDPFRNLDALMFLEPAGTTSAAPIAAPPPYVPRRGSSPAYDAPAAAQPPIPDFKPTKAKRKICGSSASTVMVAYLILTVVGAVGLVVGQPTVGIFIGLMLMIWGGLGNLGIAFSKGAIHGLMYMFVPFYSLIFILSNFEETKVLFGINLTGVAILIVGSNSLKQAPRTQLPEAPSAWVMHA